MRLQSLEIQNLRGIRQLLLKPEGKSVVVLGPNGTGKSSVVDALDFLLTGRISRLTGEGTDRIPASDVTANLAADGRETRVIGQFSLPGCPQLVKLTRELSTPRNLEIDGADQERVSPLLKFAEKGQHRLTRRELLAFVLAKGKSRAERIHALLSLDSVEEARGALVTAVHNLERQLKGEQSKKKTIAGRLQTCGVGTDVGAPSILEVVNEARRVLGGVPLVRLSREGVRSGVSAPGVRTSSRSILSRQEFTEAVARVASLATTEATAELRQTDNSLRESLDLVRNGPGQIEKAKLVGLVREGLNLLDDTGLCPLCGHQWGHSELRMILEARLLEARRTEDLLSNITARSQSIIQSIGRAQEYATSVESSLRRSGASRTPPRLAEWSLALSELRTRLEKSIDAYPGPGMPPESVDRLFCTPELLEELRSCAERFPSSVSIANPEQTAWSLLIRLEELTDQFLEASEEVDTLERAKQKATLLLTAYIKARDEVLEDIYNGAMAHFMAFYRQLHPWDEPDASGGLRPDGAGLNLDVGFHGKGPFPPAAVHSEGHQDSMGLCLYLALSLRLSEVGPGFAMLDDVVTSVDREHRRDLAVLLARLAQERQFVILTHDDVWARQLRSAGVVSSARVWRMLGWSFEGGTTMALDGDWWGEIRRSLDAGNVPAGAAALRRNLEYQLAEFCEGLRAMVPFQSDPQRDFGELFKSFAPRASDLFSRAKLQANTARDTELMNALRRRHDAFRRASEEVLRNGWVVNLQVHFNDFAQMDPNELRPVVDQFESLFRQLVCERCSGMVSLVMNGTEEAALQCPCRVLNWALPPRVDISGAALPPPPPSSNAAEAR